MQKQCFNRDWRFQLENPADIKWQPPDISTARVIELPHDWSIELDRDPASPSNKAGGFFQMGRGTYHKRFEAPADWRGKCVLVEFEGVYMNAEVWLNGNFLGRHPYGYTSFHYDLTPYLNLDSTNVLKVTVDNAGQINSRWYSGSGIYRPVWLLVSGPVHVTPWGIAVTTPQVSPEAASVAIRSRVENASQTAREVTLRSRIIDPEGATVGEIKSAEVIPAGEAHEYSQDLQVIQPRLWSPDTPELYRVKTEVCVDDKIVDTESTTFGIRSLNFSAERGFLLNGQPVKLKGGSVHHDNGVLGATSYPRAEARKVEIHKASGFNAIRCAHNPPAPSFLDACDRLGMFVIDEFFDCWREGKRFYDYHVVFEDWWQRDLESTVLRDRNHPSIIMWSIGNEIPENTGRSSGAAVTRMLADYTRLLDPTRPVTEAMCISADRKPWESTDAAFSALDIAGYNYQWHQYLADHERLPGRIMVGSESVPKEAFECWNLVQELDCLLGDFVWPSLDYLGEAGLGLTIFEPGQSGNYREYPCHHTNCGDHDLCGFKRPQSYYRDVLWGRGDKLYIAVHDPIPEDKTPTVSYWGWPEVWPNWNWPGREGQPFQVDIYSACERVELFLNGKSLGVKPSTREERFTATFEVPYASGVLTAVGYTGDQKVAECEIKTVQEPARVRLTPDRKTIQADGGDLCYVTVEIVDEQGRVHPAADSMIYFTAKGAGTIAAVGSADPLSEERYRGNSRTTYRGRCLVVVKSNGQAGEIRLRAQADGLDEAEVVIPAK